MDRNELKEIIVRVIEKIAKEEEQAPAAACLFYDNPCDATTRYAVGEEG